MAQRLIITDSTSDILPEQAAKYGIVVVPLGIQFDDGESYLEGVNLTYEDYFGKLVRCKDIPKTSQPTPESFAAHIRAAQAEQKDVIIITISTGLSGTYQSACVAKDLVGYDRVFVIDSKTCISGMRILVEEALKHDELETEALVAHLEDVKSRIRLYSGVDRLEFLQKSGRLHKALALIGNLIRLKLVVGMDADGKAELVTKKFGMKAVVHAIAGKLETVPRDPAYPLHVDYVMTQEHSDELKTLIAERYPEVRIETYPAGASIGTHIGLNACALVYVAKRREDR